MRYFLEITYDGTYYHGWQIQNNAITVQQILNQALSTLLRTEISTIGSGRTDTGVHATCQVVHFDVSDDISVEKLCHKLNKLLPRDISANQLHRVDENVNARFDAVSRAYRYKMHQQKNPFLDGKSYLFRHELDVIKMNECCNWMKDWKDFESFSKVRTEVNSFNCDIFEAYWTQQNDQLEFYVRANRFLRGMVRAMVGTLLLVGTRKIGFEEFQVILKNKDRSGAGRSVPACALYLTEVSYPDLIYIDQKQ